jgi:hypothetical protein
MLTVVAAGMVVSFAGVGVSAVLGGDDPPPPTPAGAAHVTLR